MSETVTYSVPGMTCGHCRRPSVEASRKRSGANRHPLGPPRFHQRASATSGPFNRFR